MACGQYHPNYLNYALLSLLLYATFCFLTRFSLSSITHFFQIMSEFSIVNPIIIHKETGRHIYCRPVSQLWKKFPVFSLQKKNPARSPSLTDIESNAVDSVQWYYKQGTPQRLEKLLHNLKGEQQHEKRIKKKSFSHPSSGIGPDRGPLFPGTCLPDFCRHFRSEN